MNAPLVLSREQARLVDEIAVRQYGMSSLVLMENAGRGAAEALLAIDPSPPSVAILCGKGNNAGDGFVLARHLEIRGVAATAVLLFAPEDLSPDARHNYEILRRAGAAMVELFGAKPQAVGRVLDEELCEIAWLVDAMLGTGAAGEPREPVRSAIAWMNGQPARRLALDVPSGLDCDTGERASATVRADATCTFAAAKRGFLEPAARPFLGEVRVIDIGVPPRLVRELAGV
jgi:NAD(P)H-hydrate epimerase